jgi:hypothetical protein
MAASSEDKDLLKDGGKSEVETPKQGLTLDDIAHVAHDLKRKQCIAMAKPCDNAGDVTITADENFDLDKTIFFTLTSPVKRWAQGTRINWKMEWNAEASARVEESYRSMPRKVPDNSAIYKFMAQECNFALEHADGSFMDHLHFCQEYSALYFPNESSRVLLLHSILGVGTNCFPMGIEKLPMLQQLVADPKEMIHIESFPSILRLLFHGSLIDELIQVPTEKLLNLESLSFNRVIDNVELTLSGGAFWTHLNFQLIHLLDFLPPAAWQLSWTDHFCVLFGSLHSLLTRAGKLMARVEYSPSDAQPALPGSRPATASCWILDRVPSSIINKLARKSIGQYSQQIGHDLGYQLKFRT